MMEQCIVCGAINKDSSRPWLFVKLKRCYRVGELECLCEKCGRKADSFVNYYGAKTAKDEERLSKFLLSGVIPQNQFSALMNAGYF